MKITLNLSDEAVAGLTPSSAYGLLTAAIARKPRRPPVRDWRSAVAAGPGGCLLWQGSIDPHGYALWGKSGSGNRAHRRIYELEVGPIPDGLVLDHRCRVRHCVNPDHMEPVTHAENTLRGFAPPAVNARKTHCKNGHEFTAENTRVTNGSRYCRTCIRSYDREYRRKRRAAATS